MSKFKNALKATILVGCFINQSFALYSPPETSDDTRAKALTSNLLRNNYFTEGAVSWNATENSLIEQMPYGKDEQALKISPTTSDADTIGTYQILYNKGLKVLNLNPFELAAFTTLYSTHNVNAQFTLTIWENASDSDNYVIDATSFDKDTIIEFNGKLNINKSYYDVYKVALRLEFIKPTFENDMATVSIDNIGLEFYNDFIHACGRHLRKGHKPFYMEAICFSNTYDRYVYANNNKYPYFDLRYSTHHNPSKAFTEIKKNEIGEGINKNCVRFSFNANWFTDNVTNGSGNVEQGNHHVWEWLDTNVSKATQAGVYLILDMHCAPGYEWLSGEWVQGNDEHGPELANSSHWIWNDPVKQTKMIKIWKTIAERYKDNPYIAGYQILTEPILSSENSVDEWIGTENSLAERCVKAIREVDPYHMVMVDLVNGNSKDQKLSYGVHPDINAYTNLNSKINERNVIRHRALYTPFTFSHQYATWLHRGLMFDRNKWPNGGDTDTMPEIIGNAMKYYFENLVTEVATNPIPQTGNYYWVESDKYTINEGSNIKLGSVLASIKGTMPSETEAYFDTVEIIEIDQFNNEKILRKRVITDYYQDKYPGDKSPILDYRAYGPVGAGLTLNNSTAKISDLESFFVLDQYGNQWDPKYVLAIKPGNNTIEGSFFGWFSNNSRFIPKPNHSYKVRAKIKVTDSRLLENTTVELMFFQDKNNQLLKRNKNYLRSYITSIANSAKNNDVPMALFEFGAMWQCFEEDQLNGGNMGGSQWVDDMITILRQNNIHWAYWCYHNEFMGLYPTNDWSVSPNSNDIITPLKEILRTK